MKTTFNTMTMGRLLLTMLCLFAASNSYAQKYKDALRFWLKGHVKECVTTKQSDKYKNKSQESVLRFSQDGELMDDSLSNSAKFTRRRDGLGRIAFESWEDDMRDETIGLPCIQERNYVYDSQNLLVEKNGKKPFAYSTIAFKENYEFDNNGNLIKESYKNDFFEGKTLVTNYKIEAVDQKGNWTVRTWTEEDYDAKALAFVLGWLDIKSTINYKETRVIHYYEDNTVRHTLQRGESLELLAERYKTTVEDIKAVNPDMEVAFTGMEILLPTAKHVSKTSTVSTDAGTQDDLLTAYLDATIAAYDLYEAGEYKKARKAYTALIEQYPDNVGCSDYCTRALCCYKLGKYRAAEDDLLVALNRSDCTGKYRESVSELLEKTRQRREEIHQNNANIFGGLLQVAAGTTMAVMQAKAVNKQQKSSSSGGSSSYSSDEDSDDTGGTSSTKREKRTCGLCGGKGYTAEYRPGFGIVKYVHCDDCGEVREGHYHKTCRCQK